MGCLLAFILISVFVLALVAGCLLRMKCCYGNPVMYVTRSIRDFVSFSSNVM
jgi:hypothetical protein